MPIACLGNCIVATFQKDCLSCINAMCVHVLTQIIYSLEIKKQISLMPCGRKEYRNYPEERIAKEAIFSARIIYLFTPTASASAAYATTPAKGADTG